MKEEYDKWCKRMDYMGNWAALYNSPTKMQKIGYKIYYYFVFLCCCWGPFGWMTAFVSALLKKPMPCIVSWYEIHSNGQPKEIYEAIGVILLSSIPVVCFVFRPSSFSVDGSEEMKSFEVCPTRNTKTVKAMIKAVRFNLCLAWALVIVGFIGGITIWNVTLTQIFKSNGRFGCGTDFLIVLDQIIVFPVYAVAALVTGHTVMSFAMRMMYYKNCFLILKRDLKSAKKRAGQPPWIFERIQ